jgi:pyruvate dehydrogenase E1 component alpha subunit
VGWLAQRYCGKSNSPSRQTKAAITRMVSTFVTDSSAAIRLRLYRTMFLIRRVEEILIAEYHPADEMRCPMHFCVGQEAMPAVLGELVADDDVLMSHYRSHGYYIAKRAPLDAMVAEFYGKATGANGGVAGSMELASHSCNFYSVQARS